MTGRIYIEKIKMALLVGGQGQRSRIQSGHKNLHRAGWLVMHESGTFVRLSPAGADLFA